MAQKKSKTQKKAKKIYRLEMSSSSMFFWGFCFFFLMAWIFVLGIFVGRGFLPDGMRVFSDLKDKLSKIQGIVTEKNSGQSEEQKKKDLNPELAFYKGLSSENEGTSKKHVVVVAKSRSSGRRPVQGHTKAKTEKAGSVTTLLDESKERGDQSSSQGLGFGRTYYTVQLASLGERGKAENLIRKLGNRGYQAYYCEAHLRGRIYYRVRSGRFDTREQAVDHARRLAKETGLKGFVWRVE